MQHAPFELSFAEINALPLLDISPDDLELVAVSNVFPYTIQLKRVAGHYSNK